MCKRGQLAYSCEDRPYGDSAWNRDFRIEGAAQIPVLIYGKREVRRPEQDTACGWWATKGRTGALRFSRPTAKRSDREGRSRCQDARSRPLDFALCMVCEVGSRRSWSATVYGYTFLPTTLIEMIVRLNSQNWRTSIRWPTSSAILVGYVSLTRSHIEDDVFDELHMFR